MHRLAFFSIVLLSLAFAEQPASQISDDHRAVVASRHWVGDDNFTTEPFQVHGDEDWEVLLGAWCHFGVSFVRAIVYDLDDHEVGRVTVITEGVQNATLSTGPGMYVVEIWSPDIHIYHWELAVRPVDVAQMADD